MIKDDLIQCLDRVAFANALGVSPDPWQIRALRSTAKRMLLNCSRQAGKTTTGAIVALHQAVYVPNQIIIVVSPSLRQSSEVIRKIMCLLERIAMKPKLIEENRLSICLSNSSRIICLPSKEANVRGFSADLIIEDEAARIDDEVYRALRPEVAVSNGRLILMSTPHGKLGHFYKEWVDGVNWERWEVKAVDCPRIGVQFLKEEQIALGPWFEQEYCCQFVETESQLFTYDLIAQAITSEITPLFGGSK